MLVSGEGITVTKPPLRTLCLSSDVLFLFGGWGVGFRVFRVSLAFPLGLAVQYRR